MLAASGNHSFADPRSCQRAAVTHGGIGTSVPRHVADEVLREHGADPGTAERGRGWTTRPG
jgi:hypothetical protein